MDSHQKISQKLADMENTTKRPWGVLRSVNSNTEDIELSNKLYKIGRHSSNDIIIKDLRVSTLHCILKKDERNMVSLEDVSSNGTFVETQRIGKGKAKILFPGDKFYLLCGGKVPDTEWLGYILKVYPEEAGSTLRIDQSDLDLPQNFQKQIKEPIKKTESDLGDEVRCCICIDYIYNCVTSLPCLHNFCAACYSEWMERSEFCPQCRGEVTEIKKNHTINNLIERFLEKHPEKRRSKEEYDEMDKINVIKADRMKVQKKEKKNENKSNPKTKKINDDEDETPGGASGDSNAPSSNPCDDRLNKYKALFSKFVAQ